MVVTRKTRFSFTVVPGYRVASGLGENSPYTEGTIALQKPFFAALGLDLGDCFNGTINGQFNCRQVQVQRWDHGFYQVNWYPGIAAEDFRFVACTIIYGEIHYPGYIYHVVASSKIGHFQAANVLELLAPKIKGLRYGEHLILELPAQTLVLS